MSKEKIEEMSSAGLNPVVGYATMKTFKKIKPENVDELFKDIAKWVVDGVNESLTDDINGPDKEASLFDSLKDTVNSMMSYNSGEYSYIEALELDKQLLNTKTNSNELCKIMHLRDEFLCDLAFRDKKIDMITKSYGPTINFGEAAKIIAFYITEYDASIADLSDKFKTYIPSHIKSSLADFINTNNAIINNYEFDLDLIVQVTSEWEIVVKHLCNKIMNTELHDIKEKYIMDIMLLSLGYNVQSGYSLTSRDDFAENNQRLLNNIIDIDNILLRCNYNKRTISNDDLQKIKNNESYIIPVVKFENDIYLILNNDEVYKIEPKSFKFKLTSFNVMRNKPFSLNFAIVSSEAHDKIINKVRNGMVISNVTGIDSLHVTARFMYQLYDKSGLFKNGIANAMEKVSFVHISNEMKSEVYVKDIIEKIKIAFNSKVNITESAMYGIRPYKAEVLSEAITLNKKESGILNNISVDEEGAIIIKKRSKADFMSHYAQAHKLLVEYEKVDNIKSIKYELAKLWFMNTIIEGRIMHNKSILISKSKKDSAMKARAFILNDFKKYMKFILDREPEFNFQVYYNDTQFAYEEIEINKKTIDVAKTLLKLLVLK